jgi:hypothetical protein
VRITQSGSGTSRIRALEARATLAEMEVRDVVSVHEPSAVLQDPQRWALRLLVPELWAALATPFAFLGTWVVARYGFGTRRKD